MRKLWRIINTINTALGFVSLTFLIFFIWESTQDFNLILVFGLLHFFTIPFFAAISGAITDLASPKIAMILSHFINIIALFILTFYIYDISVEIVAIIGVLTGIASGLNQIAVSVTEATHAKDDISKVYANKSLTIQLSHLVMPLIGAVIVYYTSEYSYLFLFTILLHLIIVVLLLIYRPSINRTSFDIEYLFKRKGSKDRWVLAKASFFEGLFDGITLTILPIVVLSFVGSILNWGFVNSALVIVSILISFILGRFVTDKSSQWLYALGAILFAGASIILITQYNFYVIMLFLVAMAFMEVIKEVGFHSAMEEVIEADRYGYKLASEYRVYITLFSSLGRVIPIVILIYLGLSIDSNLIIRGTLLAAGLLPIIILSVLGESMIFKSGYEEEIHLHNAKELETSDDRIKRLHVDQGDKSALPSLSS